MLRKVLIGASAIALPLTGLAVWGSTQTATAVAAPPLNCGAGGTVSFSAGAGAVANTAAGLLLTSQPAATVHSPGGASIGATFVEVTDLTIPYGAGLLRGAIPVTPAIDGQTFKVGRGVYTITRVDTGASPGFAHNPPAGGTTLTFTPALTTAILANGAVAIAASSSYISNANDTAISIGGAGCTSNQGDFYPTSYGANFATSNTSNAAASLEARSSAISSSLSWPATAGGYTNGGFPDTASFAAGAGVFCAANGEFSELNNAPVPPGTAGSSACTQGQYLYVRGRVTGTYATTVGAAQLALNGVSACTVNQLASQAYLTNACDGEASATDGQTTGTDAGVELLNAEEYGATNGDCYTGTNGFTPNSCNLPYGGDGSPLVEIVGLTLSGFSEL